MRNKILTLIPPYNLFLWLLFVQISLNIPFSTCSPPFYSQLMPVWFLSPPLLWDCSYQAHLWMDNFSVLILFNYLENSLLLTSLSLKHFALLASDTIPFSPSFLSTFLDTPFHSPETETFFSITQLLKVEMSQGLILEPFLCLHPIFPQGHYWCLCWTLLHWAGFPMFPIFQDVLHPWTLPPCLSRQCDNPNCLQAVPRKKKKSLKVKNDFVFYWMIPASPWP